MNIYEFTDYKRFLNAQIALMPKKGRGQARRLADHLSVNPVVISQILSGARDFTHEQSLDVASFFGLDERATEYLSLLILKSRAGTKRLQTHLAHKIESTRQEALKLKNQVPQNKELTDQDRSIFYSNWYYGALHLMTTMKGSNDLESMAQRFDLSRSKIAEIMDYLISRGLCTVDDRGRHSIGPTMTFIDAESPFINSHHRNWRLKSMEHMAKRKTNDFFYSGPCTVSRKDKEAIRKDLTDLINRFYQRIKDTEPEQMTCLNIDWFDF